MSKGEEFATSHGLVSTHELVARAADLVAARCRITRPRTALILGSGLGDFARHIEGATRLSFTEIPGFPAPSVQGHAGDVVHGRVHGREVIAISGRIHLYEGHRAPVVALPVRLVHALGVRTLLISNAAGAIRQGFQAGSLMVVRDHINMSWHNPLIGPSSPGDLRFPDMSAPYDAALGTTFETAAIASGLTVVSGVYAGVLGPSYETPAEVRMLARMGADAVGMSTVPEVLVARALGMRVVAISCLTNAAAGIAAHPLSHADVLRVVARVAPAFEQTVAVWLDQAAR